MPKNIVLCSDGTGNTALKGRGTNVFKMYEAIDLNGHKFDQSLPLQIAFYDDGVGTENLKFLKILGGAFGWGLSRNVRQLFTALSKCYEPGDHIFLFGFSRGAFTVRQLAGFIIGCGIIDGKHWKNDSELRKLVRKGFRAYRKRYQTWLGKLVSKFFKSPQKARQDFRQTYAVKHEQHAKDGNVRIRFIGVWDTVAAVGLPFDHLADFINKVFYRFKFPDLRLNSRVDKACHALAIDDERHSFHPELWDEEHETDDDRIEQVWFTGAHSNVGGGYPKQGISLVALDWMMTRAEASGLRFIKNVRQGYQDCQSVGDKLYDSRAGMGVSYRYKVRDVGEICAGNHTSADIHISTFNRIALGSEEYAPINLPADFNIVATDTTRAAIGEDTESLKKLTAKIREALTASREVLSKANKWKLVRRYSHYAFLASILAIVWQALKVKSPVTVESSFLSGFEKVLSSLTGPSLGDRVVKPIFTRPEIGLTLLGLIALFYILGFLAKTQIKNVFSTFWRRVSLELKS